MSESINVSLDSVSAFKKLSADGRPIVFYAGPLGLPESGASIEHAINIGLSLGRVGINTIILIFGDTGRPEDLRPDGTYSSRGISYIPVQGLKRQKDSSNVLLRKFDAIKFYGGSQYGILDFIDQIDLSQVRGMITLELISGLLLRVNKKMKAKGIPIFSEEVEWNQPGDPNLSWTRAAYIDLNFRMNHANRMIKNVIVNNRYLENHFKKLGCHVFYLPSILDSGDPRWNSVAQKKKQPGDPLRLMFSGTSKRERVDLILNAVLIARSQGVNVTMEFLGSTRELVIRYLGSAAHLVDDLGDAIVFHGWVDQSEMAGILERADFGILFRDDVIWSKACFPSKVPELLTRGIPVISNLTSNLSEYLIDGEQSLVVPEKTVDALIETIKRAAALSEAQLSEMSRKARETGLAFGIDKFSSRLNEYIAASAPK